MTEWPRKSLMDVGRKTMGAGQMISERLDVLHDADGAQTHPSPPATDSHTKRNSTNTYKR